MQKRKYSLYYKVTGKYYRVSSLAFLKDQAVRAFQNALIDGLGDHACLRPIKVGEQCYYIVHGAYSRSYGTPEAALADWSAGRDFIIRQGSYCSIRDDIHVLIRLRNGKLVVAHGTEKEAPCATATTSTS